MTMPHKSKNDRDILSSKIQNQAKSQKDCCILNWKLPNPIKIQNDYGILNGEILWIFVKTWIFVQNEFFGKIGIFAIWKNWCTLINHFMHSYVRLRCSETIIFTKNHEKLQFSSKIMSHHDKTWKPIIWRHWKILRNHFGIPKQQALKLRVRYFWRLKYYLY